MDTTEELTQRARILIEQTDTVLNILQVDVSDVPIRDLAKKPWSYLSPIFASAADDYDRLAAVEKRIKNRVLWERTEDRESRRTPHDLMQRLDTLLKEIKLFYK